MHDITEKELAYGRKLRIGAIAAPLALLLVPAVITIVLMLVAAGSPPTAAVILFLGFVATTIGFLSGIGISLFLTYKRTRWTREMRERIAADGIRAEEIEWFYAEMKPSEKRALRDITARDLLLGDAYRETLASRLTATRIIRNSRRELSMAKKRQNSLKQLRSARSSDFQAQIGDDITKISNIHNEACEMLAEAESRLAMIEAAASRSGGLADNELALKKLTARANELPLALESAKVADEIRDELEKHGLEPALNEKDVE
ncbi:MAG: hypothetical protein ACJ73D_07260 [Pyrinomonadaceae bacterium]